MNLLLNYQYRIPPVMMLARDGEFENIIVTLECDLRLSLIYMLFRRARLTMEKVAVRFPSKLSRSIQLEPLIERFSNEHKISQPILDSR